MARSFPFLSCFPADVSRALRRRAGHRPIALGNRIASETVHRPDAPHHRTPTVEEEVAEAGAHCRGMEVAAEEAEEDTGTATTTEIRTVHAVTAEAGVLDAIAAAASQGARPEAYQGRHRGGTGARHELVMVVVAAASEDDAGARAIARIPAGATAGRGAGTVGVGGGRSD